MTTRTNLLIKLNCKLVKRKKKTKCAHHKISSPIYKGKLEKISKISVFT